MAPSLGLTLYNLGQRRDPASEPVRPPRPAGRLAWLHAPTAEASLSMVALARRLIDDEGLSVVLTCPADVAPRKGLLLQTPPKDTPLDVRHFFDHWRPEVAVFGDGEVRPAALHEAELRGVASVVVDGRAPSLPRNRDGWYPGLMRSALSSIKFILAIDEPSARAFRKAGAAISAVAVTGRLEEESAALPCLEAERAALARLFEARPVWFAVNLPEVEEDAVIQAHRMALQQAHRLLLIILPADPTRSEQLAARIESDEGWAVAQRSLDEEPESGTEVFIVDNPAEYGLWYRLSPISFLGGSLHGAGAIRDPMEAAALGSAILCGPKFGRFVTKFERLRTARATRAVASAKDLGEALGDVLATDRTARLAQAAWAVATEGAEATDKALQIIRNLMDGDD